MTALSPEHDQAYQRLRMCGHSTAVDYAALDREVARFKAEGGMPPVVRRERAPGRRIGLSSLISIAALASLDIVGEVLIDEEAKPFVPMSMGYAGRHPSPRKNDATRTKAKAARKARRKSRRS